LSKLDRQREINGHLRKGKERSVEPISPINKSDDNIPSLYLSNRRVLLVGGMTKLESFYRELVEEKKGIFEYHDGYMNGGSNGLGNKVRRADLILCPVNCNSHNACLMVKRLSKKYTKPVYMLANASLNSISQALSSYQEDLDIQ